MLETRNLEIPRVRIDPVEFKRALDFLDSTPEAPIVLAAMARDQGAFSYRDFLVGAAVCTEVGPENAYLTKFPNDAYQTHYAGNFKGVPGPKRPSIDECAERKAIIKALMENPKFIFAIYTVSKEMGVDSNEIAQHDILHPCAECREMFRKLLKEGIMSPATRMVNVKDNGKFWEKHKGPFDIKEYAKTYTYDKKLVVTVGEFLEEHIPEDVKIVLP